MTTLPDDKAGASAESAPASPGSPTPAPPEVLAASESAMDSAGSDGESSSSGARQRRALRIPEIAPAQQDALDAAQRALSAAEEAHRAASSDPLTPVAVRNLTRRSVDEAQAAVRIVQTPRWSHRQPTADFLTMLSEEAKEVVEDAVEEVNKETIRQLRQARSYIEDHYNIDQAFRMLGPLQQDPNMSRDVHDLFNLVALIPVVVFNFANWSCSFIFSNCSLREKSLKESMDIPGLWTGDMFEIFWWITFVYFVADLTWMLVIPNCVKSPGVIIKHHVVTLAYIFIPKLHPEYGWIMGACMIVEVNTWFLIARRALNRNGDKPFAPGVAWWKSLRMVTVSTCFYVSWVSIRLVFYPILLLVVVREWWNYSAVVGRYINIIAITPVMQMVFVHLNVKWSIDLLRSKMKGRKQQGL